MVLAYRRDLSSFFEHREKARVFEQSDLRYCLRDFLSQGFLAQHLKQSWSDGEIIAIKRLPSPAIA
jgi:hypothetical protein